jgi:sigma-B regulation protein RsbU (phosphoserine phosphatase)
MQESVLVQHVTSNGVEEPVDLAPLTKGGSFAEVADRARVALSTHFRIAVVDITVRAPGGVWEPCAGPGSTDPGTIPDLEAGRNSTVRFWGELKQAIAVHRLHDGRELAVRIDGQEENRHFDAQDLLTLRMSLMSVDAALAGLQYRKHEKELVFELNRRLLQLNSLIDTGIEVATLDPSVSPCLLALERAVALTNASRGTVTVCRDGTVVEHHSFPPGLEGAPSAQSGMRLQAEFTFQGEVYSFEIADKESRAGVQPFEGTDRLLLDALTRQVQASLENRFLLKQSLEKQRMEQDIAVAASIQQRIIPSELPRIDGYDMVGINIPSKSVGGDYYDCIPLPDGRYVFVIADVSGKGIPAALLVSSLNAYLSAYLESTMPLVEIVARLNTAIHRASTDDKFITAFFALLDPVSGSMESVNAGHNTVYWRRADGVVVELSKGGIPLGMLDLDLPYESEQFTFSPGDRMLLYTDGIPEAQNAAQELYESRTPLKELFNRVLPETGRTFIDALLADLKDFVRDAPQADDITALYLMRL